MAAEPRRGDASSLSPEVIRERIVEIVHQQSGYPVEEIHDRSLLVEDLGFDSLTMVETAMELEDEFDVKVPDALMETVRTVSDVVAGMQRLLDALPKP